MGNYSSYFQALKKKGWKGLKILMNWIYPTGLQTHFKLMDIILRQRQKLQEEIIDLYNDIVAQFHFSQYGYEAFWSKEQNKFPQKLLVREEIQWYHEIANQVTK